MLFHILKFLFAASLITWLIINGKLDFSLVQKQMSFTSFWLAMALTFTLPLITAFRWKVLLSDHLPMSFWQSLRLTWIGLFFNCVLPGSVTGDVIKAEYAKRRNPQLSRGLFLFSVLLDRVWGLIALIILYLIFNFSHSTPFFLSLSYLMIAALAFFFLTLYFAPPIHLLRYFQELTRNFKIQISCLLISLCNQILCLFIFWLLIQNLLPSSASILHVFSLIPLGLITTAIPISPAGLGVGHVAFDQLFQFIGIEGGASLFNLFFLAQLFMFLAGVFFYLQRNNDEC